MFPIVCLHLIVRFAVVYMRIALCLTMVYNVNAGESQNEIMKKYEQVSERE